MHTILSIHDDLSLPLDLFFKKNTYQLTSRSAPLTPLKITFRRENSSSLLTYLWKLTSYHNVAAELGTVAATDNTLDGLKPTFTAKTAAAGASSYKIIEAGDRTTCTAPPFCTNDSWLLTERPERVTCGWPFCACCPAELIPRRSLFPLRFHKRTFNLK